MGHSAACHVSSHPGLKDNSCSDGSLSPGDKGQMLKLLTDGPDMGILQVPCEY